MGKRFERRIIRERNMIERRGVKMAFNAIKSQYKQVFDMIGTYSPQFVLDNLNLSQEPVKQFMITYYPMAHSIGIMYRKYMLRQKDAESDFYENTFMEKLRHYALTSVGKNITGITSTTEKYIRGAIESAITESVDNGYGVDKTSKLIRQYLTDSLGDVGKSRATTIARTELITSSNLSAVDAANSTKLPYRKFWSNSGLKGVRDSHVFAQDNYPRGIMQDDKFDMGDGTHMSHPGDPEGGVANIVNCRCSLLIEVI